MTFEMEPLPGADSNGAFTATARAGTAASFATSTSSASARTQSSGGDPDDDNPTSFQQQQRRRTSMPEFEQSHRRKSIQRIMRDVGLSQIEKQRSIQFLMDGRKLLQRRVTVECGGSASSSNRSIFGGGTNSSADNGNYRRSSSNSLNLMAGTAAICERRNAMVGEESDCDDNDEDEEMESEEKICSDIANLRRRRRSSSLENVTSDVPDYDAITAAAIAHAKSQTASDLFASQHPYKATTTMVPAIAAEASATALLASRQQQQKQQQQPQQQQLQYNSIDSARSAIEMAPKCTHYQRNCHIVSPCCGATFACRICHDDFPVLPPRMLLSAGGCNSTNNNQRMLRTSSMPVSFANSAEEHHTLPRYAIKEIICRVCFTKQSSKT
jgi:hypothetical protein